MKKYIVYWTTYDDGYDKAWVWARDEREAKEQILNEYWNIDRITSVEESE